MEFFEQISVFLFLFISMTVRLKNIKAGADWRDRLKKAAKRRELKVLNRIIYSIYTKKKVSLDFVFLFI